MEVVRRIPIPLPLLSDLCVISVRNWHNCAGHSTLVDRICNCLIFSFFVLKHLGDVAWTCALMWFLFVG